VRGMMFTFATLITLVVLNVGWVAYQGLMTTMP
jgi:hypothetical protein